MTTPAPRDIEVKFTRCSLCGGDTEESATDPCFIRVETKTGLCRCGRALVTASNAA